MRINKTTFVSQWWQTRLDAGRQLVADYKTGARPANRLWKKRVANELLWSEFYAWMGANHPTFAPFFTKQGFCIVMHRVAGTRPAYVRDGPGVRYYAAHFKSLKEHRAAWAEANEAEEQAAD